MAKVTEADLKWMTEQHDYTRCTCKRCVGMRKWLSAPEPPKIKVCK